MTSLAQYSMSRIATLAGIAFTGFFTLG